MISPRALGFRLTRSRRWAATGLAVLTLALVTGLAHTAGVRSMLLSWGIARVEAAAGVRVHVGQIHYNLLSLSGSLHDVTVAAAGSENTPFFHADRVSFDLPWRVVRGVIAVESLAIERPRLTFVRLPTGAHNLPASTTQGESPLLEPLEIGGLILRDVEVHVDDRLQDINVAVPNLDLDMRSTADRTIAGRLVAAEAIRARVGDRETRISRLDGRLAFDGTTLTIDDAVTESDEGRIRSSGRVSLIGAAQSFDLNLEARLNVARLSLWADLDPPASGTISIAGRAHGELAQPTASFEAVSADLGWKGLRGVSFEARGDLSSESLVVNSLTARLGQGDIAGDGRIPFAQSGAGHVQLRWSGVAVSALVDGLTSDPFVRLASAAAGEARAEWRGSDLRTGRWSIENRLTPEPGRRQGLAASGRLELVADSGRWRLSHDHRLAATAISGRADGRLDASVLTASTLDGTIVASATDVASALRELRAAGISLGSADASRLHGAATATASLAGTVGAPRAAGVFRADGLRFGATGPGEAEARFVATPASVVLDPLTLTVNGNTIEGRTRANLNTNSLAGELTAELSNIAALAGDIPAEWRPDGSGRVALQLGGTLDNPRASAHIALADLHAGGQSVDRVNATLQLVDDTLIVERLELVQAVGALSATGSYEHSTGRYVIDVTGRDLTVAPLAAGGGDAGVPLEARFDVRMNGTGTLTSPRGTGALDFSRLAWQDYELGPTRVETLANGDTIRLSANVPELTASLRADIDLDAHRSYRADLTVDNATMDRLTRMKVPDLSGSLSLHAEASGRVDELWSSEVALLSAGLNDVTVGGVPARFEGPPRLRLSADALVADAFDLRLGQSRLSMRGALGKGRDLPEPLRISLEGSLSDLIPIMRLAPDLGDLEGTGTVALNASATGTLGTPRVEAKMAIDAPSIGVTNLPPLSEVAVRAGFTQGVLHIQELRALWQNATLSGSGELPVAILGDALPEAYRRTLPDRPGPARATLQIDSLTEHALEPFVSAETLGLVNGQTAARISLEARSLDLAELEANVVLDRAELTLAQVPIRQTTPTRLRAAGGRIEIVDWRWAGAGNSLMLSGHAPLAPSSPTLNLAATGTLDLRMMGAFASGASTSGKASMDLTLHGSTERPRIGGRIAIEDAGVAMRDPRIAIGDLDGVLVFAGDRVEFGGLKGTANGGDVEVKGAIDFPSLKAASGTIVLSGRALAFEMPEDLRGEMDADLRLVVQPSTTTVAGTVTILRGAYREPVSLTTQLLDAVQLRRASAPGRQSGAGFGDEVTVDIAVKTAQDISIDNNYGRFQVGSDLRIGGTATSPVPTGRLTIREGGAVFLGGHTYQVVRGTVDFTSGTRIEPQLDLALETRVQRHEITLEVSGTPENIEASLRSPGLSQADVISLLLTGQPAGNASIAETEIARTQLLTLLSGEILGFAGRAVGLETVQVGRGLGGAASDFDLLATDTDPSARLTISKHLRRDVELVFSQSLREAADVTWIAIYRPLSNIEMRGATQDDGSRSYEFRHDLSFGGGAGSEDVGGAAAPAPVERVVSVRISGDHGFDEATLRRQLRLQEGSRFEFYRWQQDRDRLQRFYRDEQRLEAEISSRRRTTPAESGESGVTLEYEIERGPRTTIAVEGHSFPQDVRARMEDAWMWAVFDGFLLDDLTAIARDHLVGDGYLQAEVDAAVSPSATSEAKEIVVRIREGTRYADRRIAFRGHRAVSESTLRSVAQVDARDVEIWRDPEAVRGRLLRFYEDQGYVAARLEVGAPVFEGSSATLPVRIDEGPLFTVTSVRLDGARRMPDEAVREAFGIAAGEPYRHAALESGRRGVEIQYLRDGYNDARVSVSTSVNNDIAGVDVRLEIEEGPQQILSDVTVSGADITNAALVERALGLTPGTPANLDDFYRAEKRLYDTGVFRLADIRLEPIDAARPEGTEPVRAAVSLQEQTPYRFRYGFRLNDAVGPTEADREVRPAAVVDLQRRNLFGRAITAGIAGQLEADRRLARGALTFPYLFGARVVTNLFLSASREDFTPEGATPFVEDRSSVTAEQRFHPTDRMAVSYGYDYSRAHLFEPEPIPGIPALELRANVARLTGTYAWDRRSDPVNARDGWFHSSGIELGARSLGSDLRFVKYLSQQYYFRTFWNDVVLASAFRLGLGRGFGQDLIPSERFYAGGGTSVRGFAEDSLGPLDFAGDPRGGNGLILLNQEIRFPVYRWVRGVSFVDAGNVFGTAGDLSLDTLEAGAGAGLRIHSPFALVRIDLGVPLTSRQRQPRARWYVGIGHAF